MIFGNKKQKTKRLIKQHTGKTIRMAKSRASSNKLKSGRFFSRLVFYFLILLFLGTSGYLLFFSGFLNVSKIEIQGNEIVKSAEVERIIDSKLEGKYLKFLEKNNLLLLSSGGIKNEILSKFRIVKQVIVKKHFPNDIKISISERTPQLILNSAGKDWMIDEDGKIFDEAGFDYSYLGQDNFPVIFDESNKGLTLGDAAMNEKYISFIADFRKKSGDETGIEFDQEIRVPGISSGEIRMKTRDGWLIFLDEGLGADKAKEMLQAVLDNKIAKEERLNLEYIDLRIPNKVFYKFKDGTPEVIAKEAADKATQDSANTAPAPTASTSKKDDNKKKK